MLPDSSKDQKHNGEEWMCRQGLWMKEGGGHSGLCGTQSPAASEHRFNAEFYLARLNPAAVRAPSGHSTLLCSQLFLQGWISDSHTSTVCGLMGWFCHQAKNQLNSEPPRHWIRCGWGRRSKWTDTEPLAALHGWLRLHIKTEEAILPSLLVLI